MQTVQKLWLRLTSNWRGWLPWVIGLVGLFTLLWLYLYARLLDLPVFGALLAALIALVTLISTKVSSREHVRILSRQDTRLKAIEEALKVRPVLVVTFATGETEVEVAADWSRPVATQLSRLFMQEEPLPPGNAPLCFSVTNRGEIAAEEPSIFIRVPKGCRVQEGSAPPWILKDARWRMFGVPEDNEIRIGGDSLAPGLSYKSGYAWVVFPRPNDTYELEYAAYADNLSQPDTGVLLVHIAEQSAPPTKRFPGDEERF